MDYFFLKLLGNCLRFIIEASRAIFKGGKFPSYKEVSKRMDNGMLGFVFTVLLLIFLYFIGVLA
jgi:hypothetical protein